MLMKLIKSDVIHIFVDKVFDSNRRKIIIILIKNLKWI